MADTVWPNTGQGFAIDALDPATRSGLSTTYWMGWGTNGTLPAVGDVALGAEAAEARDQMDVSQPAVDTIRFVGVITATADHLAAGTGSIKEVGVFTASAAGTLFIRGTFPELNIETGDRLEATIDLTLADESEAV